MTGRQQPLTITMRVKTEERHAEALLAALLTLRDQTRTEAGNVRFDILGSDIEPGAFLLIEAFRNEEAVRAHRASAHFAAFKATTAGLALVIERYGAVT